MLIIGWINLRAGETTTKILGGILVILVSLRHLAQDLFYLAEGSVRARLSRRRLFYLGEVSFISPRSLWHFLKGSTRSRLPWVQEVFLACGENFRCWPKADTSSAIGEAAKTRQKPETALEKSPVPRVDLTEISFISERSAPKHAKISARSHLSGWNIFI